MKTLETSSQRYVELEKRNPRYCAIQLNAIRHHRLQIRFLIDLYKENRREWNFRIIKSHREEIHKIYEQLDREAEMIVGSLEKSKQTK